MQIRRYIKVVRNTYNYGTDGVTKTDEFSEKFQGAAAGGGGVIFNPKIYVADFGPLNWAFSA